MLTNKSCFVSILIIFNIFIMIYQNIENISILLNKSRESIQQRRLNISNTVSSRIHLLKRMCMKYRKQIKDDKFLQSFYVNTEFGKPFTWCIVPKASSSSWVKLFTEVYFKNQNTSQRCLRNAGHKIIRKFWNKKLMDRYTYVHRKIIKFILMNVLDIIKERCL